MEYNDTNKYKNAHNNNNNISSAQNFSPYFNYGYKIEQWKIYANKIRSKLDELNEPIKNGKIRLTESYNEMEYLLELPFNFREQGKLYHEDKYENLKLYKPKEPENKRSHLRQTLLLCDSGHRFHEPDIHRNGEQCCLTYKEGR